MAQDAPSNASFSFLVCLCLLVSFMVSINALSFKLIHRDSVHSPLYPGRNLSDIEIVQRGMEISRARMSYLGSMISKATNGSIHPDVITPPIGNQKFLYMVDIAFGSPSKIQHLVMDTGSFPTWIQCQPCIRCYPQAYKIFEPAMSSTYSKLPCNHPLCFGSGFSCSGNDCVYTFIYGTPSQTKGVFSSETITSTAGRSLETVSNVAFGCSNDNVDFPYDDSNLLGGLLGLGYGAQSILSQLGPNARGRFSYCLQGFQSTLHSYLRFGSDAFINGQYQVTPLMRYFMCQ